MSETSSILKELNHRIQQDIKADRSQGANVVLDAKDATSRSIASEGVELIGTDLGFRPDGGGVGYADNRMIGVAVDSVGPGILSRTAAYGLIGARESPFIAGRLAVGPDDTLAEYGAAIGAPITWNNSNNDYLNLPGLTINAKCAQGVTTLIQATCAMELDPSNTATVIESSLSIGAGVQGKPWKSRTDAAEGDTWETSSRGLVVHRHSRLFLGTDATASNGVVIVPRVRRIGGASGSYNPSSNLQAGATIRVTSNANVRSSPSYAASTTMKPGAKVRITGNGTNIRSTPAIDDNIVYIGNSGNTGYIAAGPYAASGYNWYLCAIADVGAGYIASSNLAVVAEDPNANVLYVAPAGKVGTIVSGPVNADGYWWYLCNITDVGSGYIASTQLAVTNNVPPISQINAIVNAWISVERIPV